MHAMGDHPTGTPHPSTMHECMQWETSLPVPPIHPPTMHECMQWETSLPAHARGATRDAREASGTDCALVPQYCVDTYAVACACYSTVVGLYVCMLLLHQYTHIYRLYIYRLIPPLLHSIPFHPRTDPRSRSKL
eukprot:GHVU01204741.1.p1 GENE.GHVU01204741.1~~GHVU01204741.1.p1  ORF type:complete len:134 (-),score=5.28 GHVU01204741.1:153-554(-)